MYKYIKEISQHYKLCYYITLPTINTKDTDLILDKIINILNLEGCRVLYDIDRDIWVEWGYINNRIQDNLTRYLSKLNIHNINIIITHIQKKEYFNPRLIDHNVFKVYENGYTSPDKLEIIQPKFINQDNIGEYTDIENLPFDNTDIIYYKNLFRDIMDRNPTNVELTLLGQWNSEKIQKWFINGIIFIDGDRTDLTLREYIDSISPYGNITSKGRSINDITVSIPYYTSKYNLSENYYHTGFNIYDNNLKSIISPFNGSAEAISNRIKRSMSNGRGAYGAAGITGYSVGNLNLDFPWEENIPNYNYCGINHMDILIRLSNGSAYYSSRIGEPIINGYTRIYGNNVNYTQINNNNDWANNSFNNKETICEHVEFIKPIVYNAGISKIIENSRQHESPFKEALIVHIGSKIYKTKSISDDILYDNKANLINTIGKLEPIIHNGLYKIISRCHRLGLKNPILSIKGITHGGIGCTTLELIPPFGTTINIDTLSLRDNTMSPFEILNSKNDSQYLIMVHPKQYKLIDILARRENIKASVIGICKPDDKLAVINKKGEKFVNLNISDISLNKRRKRFDLISHIRNFNPYSNPYKDKQRFTTDLYNVLQHPSVCSKRFIMNKTDRSVGGLVVQQQCVGPYHLPISDYSIVADSHIEYSGVVTSIGEQPICGLVDCKSMIDMSVSEMLLNMIFCKVDSLDKIIANIYISWSCDKDCEKYRLSQSIIYLVQILESLDITIGEHHENINMSSVIDNNYIKSPGTIIVNGISSINDFRKRVTPDIKGADNSLLLIYLGSNKHHLGGSIYNMVHREIGSNNQMPSFGNIDRFKVIWKIIQTLIVDGLILSGHDVSDGGVITTVLEMCFAGNYGIVMNIMEEIDPNHFFYSQEMAIVVETEGAVDIMNKLGHLCDVIYLGETVRDDIIDITFNGNGIFFNKMSTLRNIWDTTSQKIEAKSIDDGFIIDDKRFIKNTKFPLEIFPENFMLRNIDGSNGFKRAHKVAIFRTEGTTGDKELANAFYSAGFWVYDINLNDIIKEPRVINEFKGIGFPGGFTYDDLLGGGIALSKIIKENSDVWNEFQKFFRDKTKFSVGFGNGCQLMGELGVVPYKFTDNLSRRFESRWSYIRLKSANSPFLKGMDGSILGVWSCHGEGRAIKQKDNDSVIAQYVDWDGNRTEKYPYNPNGSEFGVAGCTSKSGRHLAIMSHPERSMFKYQIPWSGKMDNMSDTTPWYKLFTNIWDWSNN